MPTRVAVSEQAPALGLASYAAVAAGIYPDMNTAIKEMGSGFKASYLLEPEGVNDYQEKYEQYILLGEFVEERTNGAKANIAV